MAKWLDNAIFYEIYPQSFLDTNGDGIGDFQGIIEKLDYIKELGCNAIWMNPCFASPFGDAGYDVADYYQAAPRYGTNADLKRLFNEVHKRNMHILLDLVPGHTSVAHPWFKESCKADRNEFTDRYIWTDSTWGQLENMGSLCGISEREGSVIVNFFAHQPALNYGFYKKTLSWVLITVPTRNPAVLTPILWRRCFATNGILKDITFPTAGRSVISTRDIM